MEAGRAVSSDVGVSLLETLVLADVVEVVTADNDGTFHAGGLNNATEDTTADGDVASEGALLVNVVALNGVLGGLEAKTDVLPEAGEALLLGLADDALAANEDSLLLLEGLLDLLEGNNNGGQNENNG